MKYDDILQTIGNTPVVRLNHFRDHFARELWVKVESFNPANPAAQERTAEEIWADFGDGLDALVSSTGTGGTITGVGNSLKARHPAQHGRALHQHRSVE